MRFDMIIFMKVRSSSFSSGQFKKYFPNSGGLHWKLEWGALSSTNCLEILCLKFLEVWLELTCRSPPRSVGKNYLSFRSAWECSTLLS